MAIMPHFGLFSLPDDIIRHILLSAADDGRTIRAVAGMCDRAHRLTARQWRSATVTAKHDMTQAVPHLQHCRSLTIGIAPTRGAPNVSLVPTLLSSCPALSDLRILSAPAPAGDQPTGWLLEAIAEAAPPLRTLHLSDLADEEACPPTVIASLVARHGRTIIALTIGGLGDTRSLELLLAGCERLTTLHVGFVRSFTDAAGACDALARHESLSDLVLRMRCLEWASLGRILCRDATHPLQSLSVADCAMSTPLLTLGGARGGRAPGASGSAGRLVGSTLTAPPPGWDVAATFPPAPESLPPEALPRSLQLAWCPSLAEVSISGATRLQQMRVTSLGALMRLSLIDCTSLHTLAVTSPLPKLTHLDLSGCECLTDCALAALLGGASLGRLGKLPSLLSLRLARCDGLTSVTVDGLPSLRILDVTRCAALRELTVRRCTALEAAALDGCDRLEELTIAHARALSLEDPNVDACAEAAWGGDRPTREPTGSAPRKGALRDGSSGAASEHYDRARWPTRDRLELDPTPQPPALPRLRTLQLPSCVRLAEGWLVAVAHGAPLLEAVDVSYCARLSDAAVGTLARACAGLRRLNLCNCRRLTDRSLAAVAEHAAALEALDVRWCTGMTGAECARFQLRGLKIVPEWGGGRPHARASQRSVQFAAIG
mmetsp:Transcript_38674/g.106796  ORF Transcript_38674/g.106796 Transcript_38674/m.106796 type:complete len:660 (-) Transcript_38674:109-2088(-)